MGRIIHLRYAAAGFDLHDTLLVEPLTTASDDQRLTVRFGQIRLSFKRLLNMVLPHLKVRRLRALIIKGENLGGRGG